MDTQLLQTLERVRGWSADQLTPLAMHGVLRALALATRLDPRLGAELTGRHRLGLPWSWEATLGFTTADGAHQASARFHEGAMEVSARIPDEVDLRVTFAGLSQMRAFFLPGTDPLNMLLSGEITVGGNLTHLTKFSHLATMFQRRGKPLPAGASAAHFAAPGRWQDHRARRSGLPGEKAPHLGETTSIDDPSLSGYSLDDLPRIKRRLHAHRTVQPRICTERARLLTDFVVRQRLSGQGHREPPALHRARALREILGGKAAIIAEDDLLAGTTTSHEIGVVIYPETFGTTIWPELLTVGAREMNPYLLDEEDARCLSREIFPFWIDENIREHTKRRDGDPESLLLDERFRLYFQWKSYAVSHTIADLPALLRRGLGDIAEEARRHEVEAKDDEKKAFYQALGIALEAVIGYARRLADEARALGRAELARRCEKVPARPAETLAEAVQSIWITFLCLHQENVNAGLSLGRLDLWLDPYLQADLEGCQDEAARAACLKRSLELVCALMLKLTDHLPLVPDLGNRLFGGSSSDQVITLGGLREDGSSAVCDMTWLFLKATEMLALRDPNMNARYAPGVNSEAYLRRLCEVNLLTGATPSLHNDDAMIPALVAQGFPESDSWDWSATGCVEPTICGRHFGHTGCIMFNAVAALEMALHDGVHPALGDGRLGPATGSPETLPDFEAFLEAACEQLRWLLDMAVDANNRLGRSHQELMPSPLLSALFQGPMDSGRDVIDGGARFNSTGVAVVGLPDVIDSLVAVESLIYDQRRSSWPELLEALETNFEGQEPLLAEVLTRVPKFGQDQPRPREIAGRLLEVIHDHLSTRNHYRGGRYLPGYWSISYHQAFGLLTGALPSGRLRGKAFAPGLTPTPNCWSELTEQLRAVASLDTTKMPNNLAFNVKVVPGPDDEHQRLLDRMAAYVGAYFELGGMQLQFNVVDTDTLRRAMDHPEDHRDLLVRISGYNAYFVDLSRPMQEELIERTAHRLGR